MKLVMTAMQQAELGRLAEAAYPLEACALLVGRGGETGPLQISRIVPAANVAAHPARAFEIDPAAHIALLRDLRDSGSADSVIGHWHSHPNGRAEPSATDAGMVHDPVLVWMISAVDAGGCAAVPRAFVPQPEGRFAPVDVSVSEQDGQDMDFRSDNVAGAAPEILDALASANAGTASAYGDDDWTRELDGAFSVLFDTECRVFPVATGTAANALALGCLAPGYGAVFAHQDSHIVVDECNAPEFFTGGAKLVPLSGDNGKISVSALEAAIAQGWAGVQHHPQPAAVSITQATESGTVYSADEVAHIAHLCRANGMHLHMDGARFANAVAGMNVSPAALTWKAGVDVLSFGATKNGAFAAEAVVFFRPALADSFRFRRKRGGHLFSKSRFLSVQLLAMLQDGLWLRLARQANTAARKLADGLRAVEGCDVAWPVQANEVFARIPPAAAERLRARGFRFHPWNPENSLHRFVCAFDKTDDEIAGFLRAAAEECAA